MKTSIKTITPAIARALLQNKNTHNRAIRTALVASYARDMSEGNWGETGDPIRFDTNGTLLDGQHRLAAIVTSGVKLRTVVVSELDPEVFALIDIGRKRTTADTLSVDKEANASLLAASLGVVFDYENRKNQMGKAKFTNMDVLVSLEQHPGIRDSVAKVGHNIPRGLIPTAIAVGCHYLFSRKDLDRADSFVQSIITGENLGKGSPALLFRNRMIQNSQSVTKLPRKTTAAMLVKAWNSDRNGKKLRLLRHRADEEFPQIA